MRLLNVHTMKLEEYFGSQIPQYAILSHCWGAEEVTFQHINDSEWRTMRGATKIEHASSYCKEQGLSYIWIDTCCIDKSSSAELSEAINSMYGWYEGSNVCYAYLADVELTLSTHEPEDAAGKDKAIRESRWFNRGWTLQELIAPKKVDFFDSQWRYLGSKEDLSPLLSSITTIPEDVLANPENRRGCSVARKMTWAAKRQTTRIEDVAYSLLGIFDVNMPLLYGEGQKAFIRLEEEILKETDDQSLLAWGLLGNDDWGRLVKSTGVLATSPEAFLGSEDVVPIPSKPGRQPQSLTSRGLRVELPLCTESDFHSLGRQEFAILDCQYKNDFSGAIGIPVIPTGENSLFLRDPIGKGIIYPTLKLKEDGDSTIYITKRPYPARTNTGIETCLIQAKSAEDNGYEIFLISSSRSLWNEKTRVLQMKYDSVTDWPLNRASGLIAFCNSGIKSCFIVMITSFRDLNLSLQIEMSTRIKIFTGPVEELEKWVRETQQSDLRVRWKDEDTVVLPNSFHRSGHITINARAKREEVLNQEIIVLSIDLV